MSWAWWTGIAPAEACRHSTASQAREGGQIPLFLSTARDVLGTRVVSVLGVISWSVVTAGAEKSIYVSEHWERHIQKLSAYNKPRAKQGM